MSEEKTEVGTVVLLHTLPPVIADGSWRKEVLSPYRWRAAASQAGTIANTREGEAGGFYVACEELGARRAYLKPRHVDRGEFRNRACREKICSDLAHDLDVRVPPALLYRRDQHPAKEEEHTCLSLVMYPKQWSWEFAKGYIVDPFKSESAHKIAMAKLPTAAARGLAFDAWVGQLDHDDHPNNIIFGYPFGAPEDGEFVFLDYAWSLGFGAGRAPYTLHPSWENGQWGHDRPIPFPPHMRRFLDKVELEQIVAKIEGFDDAVIGDIVGRVPQAYIDDAERRIIIEGLVGRKTLIRRWLKTDLEVRP